MAVKTIPVKGTTVQYVTAGKGKNIILVHGAGSNHTTWLNTVDHLKNARWVALDCRGHGRSGGTPDIDKTAADIIAIADKEKMRTFTIAGICLGAAIALEVARRAPARVNGIIVVSPFDRKLVRLSSLLRLSCYTARAFIRLFPMRKNLSYINYRLPPRVPVFLTIIKDCEGVHMRHYGTAALNSISRPMLMETHAPMLVISGKKDITLRRTLVAKRIRANRRAAWVELDTNHHVITWKPKEVASLINGFLSRLR